MIQFEKPDLKKVGFIQPPIPYCFLLETIHQKKRVLKNQTHFHDNDQTYLSELGLATLRPVVDRRFSRGLDFILMARYRFNLSIMAWTLGPGLGGL